MFYRVRGYYRDLLRAKFKPVSSDSEASSEATDPEEDRTEVLARREERERRRAVTEKKVKRLRDRGNLIDQYRDVDRVTEWMDSMGYQNKVDETQQRVYSIRTDTAIGLPLAGRDYTAERDARV